MDTLLTIGAAAIVVLATGRLLYEVFRLVALNRRRGRALRDAAGGEPGSVGADLERLDSEAERVLRLDHTLSGAILAGLGLAGVYAGRAIGYGEWAVSLYVAGLVCIVAGLGLALVGSVLRILAGPVVRDDAS